MTTIGKTATAELLARAATVGFTPEGVAQQLGATVAELPTMTPAHAEIIEAMIARTAKKTTVAGMADRTATRVAALTGLPPARNDGRCHYCGMPLDRRGYCQECI